MEREELLLLRLQGQYLLQEADGPSAAGGLCGVQAQFLRNAVHALRIRTEAPSLDGLVKTWTLRDTVHLLPESDLPLYIRHCGGAEMVCDSGWYAWTAARGRANPPQRERELARMLLSALAEGVDDREALRAHLRQLGMTETEESHAFDPWGGLIRELAEVGALAFQVRMANGVHPEETKRYRLITPFSPMEESVARQEIARRYLTHYGPVTLRDAAYFLHWTQAEAKGAFIRIGAETVACDGATYWYIPASIPAADMPEVILLAGFDPLLLGYRKEDSPFLPTEHLRGIFSLAGIVHPAILLRGRIVGRWKEQKGRLELTAFEPVDQVDKRRIEGEAARLYSIRKCIWQ